MSRPKVSVVVPVYNVAGVLPKCLDSLAAQTLTSIEFIVVNDGSTDGSGDLLRKQAKLDPRFHLVERANGGYSAARNTGLREANGHYVGFVDSDDWIEPEFFEHLVGLAEASGADLAQCGFSWHLEQEGRDVLKDNSWIPPLLSHTGGTLRGGAEAVLFEDIAVWKKIYRRDLMETGEFTFDESMAMGEDVPFHLTALCLARKIAASDRPLYHYRKQRPGQQTAIRDHRLLSYFRIFEKMDELLMRHGIEGLEPWFLHLQLSRHCWGYEMASPDVRDEYYQRFRKALIDRGIARYTMVANGCSRYGRLGSRIRWLSLRIIHPMVLRALIDDDRPRFDRIIRLRQALQDPGSILRSDQLMSR